MLSREGLLGSRYVLGAVALVIALQLLFTYAPPMQAFFRTEAIDARAWLVIVALSAPVLLLVELEKWLQRTLRYTRRGETRDGQGSAI